MMKGKKPFCALLIALLLFSVAMMNVRADPQLPKLFVDPPISTATQMDEIFTVDIRIANVTDLADFEFKLGYNTTILDAVNCLPLVAYSLLLPLDPETGKWMPINDTLGLIHGRIMMPSFPISGDHALVKVTFKATYANSASCTLNLTDTILKHSDGSPILHDVEDGNYEFVVLGVTVETDKLSYLPGENVEIHGNLTLDSLPHQGLVALEVDNPKNDPIVVRTVQIGPTPSSEEISILGVVPCDMWGTPKVPPTYKRDPTTMADYFYVKVTVKNNNPTESKNVVVTANIYDVNNVPVGCNGYATPLYPGSSDSPVIPIIIPEWASLGNATVYANAFTNWPGCGFIGDYPRKGVPHCPEENATFQITNGGYGAGTLEAKVSGDSTGNYSLTFKLPNNPKAGIYRVYANAFYGGQSATSRAMFGVNAIYVPYHYSTIQEAVDAATPTNNSILVWPGTYNEDVTINKAVILVGIDPSNTIINGTGTGTVVTIAADNVEISRFIIQNSGSSFPASGITLNNYSNIIISENTILDNYYGIYLTNSSRENTIRENTITLNNGYGIYINYSTSITLKHNTMIGNDYNFGVFGDSMLHFAHNIDTSNTMDGKPTIYWVNQHDKQVPSNAGYLAIVNSSNITVKDLNLTKNGQGMLLAFTVDSLIERVNTSNNEYGIYMVQSYRNRIIIGSRVSNNTVGIYQRDCYENIIYRNNFINNTQQVYNETSTNTWNDIIGKGNYWSDYNGTDLDDPPDGVGDEYLPWQGVDWYPLMNPWIPTHDVAITNVTFVLPCNETHLYPGWVINVTATVRNEGDFTDTINVTAYYDGNPIEMKVIYELARLDEIDINFAWDTQGVPPGNYTISANASVVPGETDTTDNTYVDGNVTLLVPTVHDLNVTSVTPIIPNGYSQVYSSWVINITVSIKNEGHYKETINVTAYYNGNIIDTKPVTLYPLTNTTLIFIWNTTGVARGNYTIKAVASNVTGETNTDNNTFIDGTVQVKLWGDVDDDGKVFATDMVLVLIHFGESSEEFPEGDIDRDGKVFATDLVIILMNFGAGGP